MAKWKKGTLEIADKKRKFTGKKEKINMLTPCFFCQKNPSHDSSEHIVDIFKLVKIPCAGFSVRGWRYGYYTRQIKIPRCESCKNQHNQEKQSKEKLYFTGFIAGAVLGFFVSLFLLIKLAIREGRMHSIVIIGPFVFALFTGSIGLFVAKTLRTANKSNSSDEIYPVHFSNSYLPVSSALKQGWKVGAGPEKEYNAILMGHNEEEGQ